MTIFLSSRLLVDIVILLIDGILKIQCLLNRIIELEIFAIN